MSDEARCTSHCACQPRWAAAYATAEQERDRLRGELAVAARSEWYAGEADRWKTQASLSRKALEDIGHWQERLTDRTAAHFKSIALAGLAALDATPVASPPLGLLDPLADLLATTCMLHGSDPGQFCVTSYGTANLTGLPEGWICSARIRALASRPPGERKETT